VSLVVARAAVVRSVVNKASRPGPINIPGLTGVDCYRVKENDNKFAKALRDLVPPSLRADLTTGTSSRTHLGGRSNIASQRTPCAGR
jgi:hypothetical protein